jgi:hypothetical protein
MGVDIRKDLRYIILECLTHKPPEHIIIGDETLGGLVGVADEAANTILHEIEGLFYSKMGELLVSSSWAEYEEESLWEMATKDFLTAIGQDMEDGDDPNLVVDRFRWEYERGYDGERDYG